MDRVYSGFDLLGSLQFDGEIKMRLTNNNRFWFMRKRIPRFGNCSPMLVIVLASIPLIWLSGWYCHYLREQAIIEKLSQRISSLEFYYEYDYEFAVTNHFDDAIFEDGPDIPFRPKAEPPGPKWIRKLLGQNVFSEVASVYIRDPSLDDIERLSGLRGLQYLAIRDCPDLSDLDGLRGLDKLKGVYLFNTGIKNVDGLQAAHDLKFLLLDDCPELTDLDGVQGLTNLKKIGLKDCQSLKNIDGLATHHEIVGLGIFGCPKLTNLDALRDSVKLEKFNIGNCRSLKDVSGLQGAISLKLVRITNCGSLKSVSGLQGAVNLTHAFIINCNSLELDLDGIVELPKLKRMEATCKSIRGLDAVERIAGKGIRLDLELTTGY